LEARGMSQTLVGLKVPDFSLPGTGGVFRLGAQRGHPLVIYFYPKDATPGCTTEAMQFRDQHPHFVSAQCPVYGISRDGLKSHDSFRAKFALPFHLLSDAEESACRLFNAIKNKKLYGREVRGVERCTFLIDADGIVRGEWRAVKANGHAEAVLAAVRALQ
jgi:peroxiredoxin Q/BCP